MTWSDNFDGRLTFLGASASASSVQALARAGQLPGEAPDLEDRNLLVQYSELLVGIDEGNAFVLDSDGDAIE